MKALLSVVATPSRERNLCMTLTLQDVDLASPRPHPSPSGPAVPSPKPTQLLAERIYWDQASVLVQLGLLNPAGRQAAAELGGFRLGQQQRRPHRWLMQRCQPSLVSMHTGIAQRLC